MVIMMLWPIRYEGNKVIKGTPVLKKVYFPNLQKYIPSFVLSKDPPRLDSIVAVWNVVGTYLTSKTEV